MYHVWWEGVRLQELSRPFLGRKGNRLESQPSNLGRDSRLDCPQNQRCPVQDHTWHLSKAESFHFMGHDWCPHFSHHPTMIGINGLLDGYYFWWCPIFPSHGTVTPTPALGDSFCDHSVACEVDVPSFGLVGWFPSLKMWIQDASAVILPYVYHHYHDLYWFIMYQYVIICQKSIIIIILLLLLLLLLLILILILIHSKTITHTPKSINIQGSSTFSVGPWFSTRVRRLSEIPTDWGGDTWGMLRRFNSSNLESRSMYRLFSDYSRSPDTDGSWLRQSTW